MANSLNSLNEMDTASINEKIKQHWLKKDIYLGALAIVVTIALCVAAIYYKDALMDAAYMAGYSLLGMFIIAFIAGSILSITAVPIPYGLVVLILPSVLAPHWGILAPVLIGIISALGAALGQLLTFIIGYESIRLSQRVTAKANNRFYTRAMKWAQRHGSWTVFAMSAIINPIHLPMTITIATLRYPPHKFFIYSLLGNIIKSLCIAFCGYFGLNYLFHFLGV